MNRWRILTILRYNNFEKPIAEYTPKEIEQFVLNTPIEELQEGVIEYLLFQMHEGNLKKHIPKGDNDDRNHS